MRGANEALPAVQVRRRRARNAHRHRRSEAADSAEEARHEQQYGGLNRVPYCVRTTSTAYEESHIAACFYWRPQPDSNRCYRRESATNAMLMDGVGISKTLKSLDSHSDIVHTRPHGFRYILR